MKIGFINPQGNFDNFDSHLTEHPDFGGQLIYVKELAMAMSKLGIKVDIITRKIVDDKWPEFSKSIDYYDNYNNLRIIRLEFGGNKFLQKEKIWPYLNEFSNQIIKFYGNEIPDFFTTHYADGGYTGALLKKYINKPFSFTAHSLGAQKMDKLNVNEFNYIKYDKDFNFTKRINAEKLSIKYCDFISVSTVQEKEEQYMHDYYKEISQTNLEKFNLIPPGVNTKIFNPDLNISKELKLYLDSKIKNYKNLIILSSRLEFKKNHLNALKAFIENKNLNNFSKMVIVLRNIDNPFEIDKLNDSDRNIIKPMIDLILKNNIENKIIFLNIKSQKDLACTYSYLRKNKAIFCLPSFYEPFGLAPLEAAACKLPIVATKNGGPKEIFKNKEGILIDPENPQNIAEGFLTCFKDYLKYSDKSYNLVINNYTWEKTAEKYLKLIENNKLYIKNKFLDLNLDKKIIEKI
ncbi:MULTISPECIES: glycosyltransferase [Oceanotoga]|jgi:sucrose-phosphate synthase|uniref:sucrose-phosphate synthase n=1 Tax=Oceanotoga teriensis TaxID=515440 RepID=A0AA45C4L5_9BACT|nr:MULTISPECIES: glycosyltransferase [Oceanotoga]MDN5343544.1 sucrose-phosphate synthase [Oceanotoga sp.]MDO7977857.1 glycosyltransferase [Oceanotoga teriensis]PWJ86814.1 sucrose-phosphate synthase [Oceanotoga teriensis]